MTTAMNRKPGILSRKLDEQLSAYLDNRLDDRERARLEARMAADPTLQAELETLRRTVALTRSLPPVAPPRNFLLPRHVAAAARRAPVADTRRARIAPWLTAATAVTAVLFVLALIGPADGWMSRPAAPAPLMKQELVVEVTKEVELQVTVEAETLLPTAPAAERAMPPAPTGVVLGAPRAPGGEAVTDTGESAIAATGVTAPPVAEETVGVAAFMEYTAPLTVPAPVEGSGPLPMATPRLDEYATQSPRPSPWRAAAPGLGLVTLTLALAAAWAWRARRRN